ncbi:MAG: universal stress protein [Burkholderiaceae bacterium]
MIDSLTRRFQALIIGIAACQPMQLALAAGFVPGQAFELDSSGCKREMEATEAEFRSAMHGHDHRAVPLRADLVVAGAYGHSRFIQWLRGAVTRDLLRKDVCALLSH